MVPFITKLTTTGILFILAQEPTPNSLKVHGDATRQMCRGEYDIKISQDHRLFVEGDHKRAKLHNKGRIAALFTDIRAVYKF